MCGEFWSFFIPLFWLLIILACREAARPSTGNPSPFEDDWFECIEELGCDCVWGGVGLSEKYDSW